MVAIADELWCAIWPEAGALLHCPSGRPSRADVVALARRMGVTEPQMERLAHLPDGALAAEHVEPLPASTSLSYERLLAIFEFAALVFNSPANAASWLSQPIMALGGRSPIVALTTGTPPREIHDVLGRIAHGIVG